MAAQSKTTSQLANKATPALTDKLYLSDASTTPPTDKYVTVSQLSTVAGTGISESGTFTLLSNGLAATGGTLINPGNNPTIRISTTKKLKLVHFNCGASGS